jgi:hypothetical protein
VVALPFQRPSGCSFLKIDSNQDLTTVSHFLRQRIVSPSR